MGRLTGRSAIITGATSGIGRATALLFAQEGADLVITGRKQKLGRQVAEEIQRAGGGPAQIGSRSAYGTLCLGGRGGIGRVVPGQRRRLLYHRSHPDRGRRQDGRVIWI